MGKVPNYDAKVKTILDSTKPGERVCEMTGEKWLMDDEEIGWYKKFNVPPSRLSPKGRLWSLSSFFLVYQWWWNKHAETGAPVLTSIHPASGVRVLPDKEWFEKDFSNINLEFDANRSFFEMFRELQLKVPQVAARNIVQPENSIAQFSLGDKNGYFVAASTSKDCCYVNDSSNAELSIDLVAGCDVTNCYHVSHSSRMYNCKFVYESYDCVNSSFLFDCRNCECCFGATNKRNRKYLFWNEQLSKEEWERKMAEVNLGSYAALSSARAKFLELVSNSIWPENFNMQSDNSIGEYLIKCSDNKNCYYGRDSHHNYFCYGIWSGAEGNAFCCAVPGTNSYQSGPLGNSANMKFSIMMHWCDDCEYSFGCYECSHCFGCVGLRHKKFCIFNKEYSENEYWLKLDEIKCAMLDRGEYGQPIPSKYSTSYYPEGGPLLYVGAEMEDWDIIGMPKFEASDDGAFGTSRTEGKTMLQINQIPDDIKNMDDSWIGKIIFDPDNKRPFTYLKPEMEFYRKHNLAAPRRHFVYRIRDLMWSMNMATSEEVDCVSCARKLTISTNHLFKKRNIYCRACYLNYLEQHG